MAPSRALGRTQVHLDFHTPHHVGAIGEEFDAAEFAATLVAAGADWVNLFAKCHHGWSYYPTRAGRIHPALGFDLLGAQVSACRAAGMGIGVYYTVGWSELDLVDHPERAETGRRGASHSINIDPDAGPDDPRPANSWTYLCPDGDYLEMMIEQVAEVVGLYDPDGIFFDITAMKPCWCTKCRDRMSREGVDCDQAASVESFNNHRWERAFRALRSAAAIEESGRLVFFNGSTVVHGNDHHARDFSGGLSSFNTHQELEHMPTTWGGYDRLPLRARYYHSLGFDLVAMSGRFHTDWGEFGGYKSRRALEYEARSMIASGARCSFGDQLHPCGRLDQQTYSLLGDTYRAVGGLWEYVDGARPDSRLAVCLSSREDDDQGLAKAMLEAHREFVVVAPGDLDPVLHQAVVLAGPLAESVDEELTRFATGGGRILALGDAVQGRSAETLAEVFGIVGMRPRDADGDYTSFASGEFASLGVGKVYNYEPGLRFDLTADAEPLASIHDALFDRTYRRFFSHQNAPPRRRPSPYPAVHRQGEHLVAAHPLGRLYLHHGAEAHRSLLWALLYSLDRRPIIEVSGLPPGGRISVLHQPRRRRTIVHILYAPPTQRGRAAVIDDVVAIPGVSAKLRLGREVTGVHDAMTGSEIPWVRLDDGAVSFDLAPVEMHAAVLIRHPATGYTSDLYI